MYGHLEMINQIISPCLRTRAQMIMYVFPSSCDQNKKYIIIINRSSIKHLELKLSMYFFTDEIKINKAYNNLSFLS